MQDRSDVGATCQKQTTGQSQPLGAERGVHKSRSPHEIGRCTVAVMAQDNESHTYYCLDNKSA